jgi:hypothetical protein
MTTQTDTEAQLKIMVEPVKHQALIDKISALMLLGKVDFYAGKQATEDGDWERVRRLIEEADHDRS